MHTADDYFAELEEYLRQMPETERAETMTYYREYAQEGGLLDEEQLREHFGPPEVLAARILEDEAGKHTQDAPQRTEETGVRPAAVLVGIMIAVAALGIGAFKFLRPGTVAEPAVTTESALSRDAGTAQPDDGADSSDTQKAGGGALQSYDGTVAPFTDISVDMAAVNIRVETGDTYVFTKHFALNDQEEGRYGISTWSNEQAIRELYLEGFEGSVAKGGGMGVMSSFNRIGVVWSGAHHGLMTGILRDEWGMDGAAITDCSVMASFMDYRLGVLAGQDLWDGYSMGMATLDGLENDPAIVNAVQRAVKNIAYSVTHSQAMNIGNATVRPITPWWQMTLYVITGVMAVLTAGSVVMLVRSRRQKPDTE